MASSRITINFSLCQTGEGHQLKGRVLEAAATGTLLLESANDVTPAFFEPGRDYVPFAGIDDLMQKVAYFLSHPGEAAAIAARAREKALASYGADRFWLTVADRARSNLRASAQA
jgi:spore maturation protein CgeB